MSGMCRRLGMSAAAPSCSCPPTACALEMPSPSSWPDTPAQEHVDTVRAWIADYTECDCDEDSTCLIHRTAPHLDALLAEVERLTAERDEAVMKKARMDNWGYSDRGLQARAEAAERERDEALGRAARAEAAHGLLAGTLAHVERLTAELKRAAEFRPLYESAVDRAEAAERERDIALAKASEPFHPSPSLKTSHRPDRFVWRPEDGPLLRDENQAHGYETRAQLVARAEAAEALAERRGEALRQIKPLVTGDLPPLTPLPMTMRCVGIADIVDAALADGGDGDGAAA